MNTKIYLGDKIQTIVSGEVSKTWRVRFEYDNDPQDLDTFAFKIQKNDNPDWGYCIRTFNTISNDGEDNYVLLGADGEGSIINLTQSLIDYPNIPNMTVTNSSDRNPYGYYDIYIEWVGNETDVFIIDFFTSSGLPANLNIFAPVVVKTETGGETITEADTYNELDLYSDENIEFTSKLSDIEKLSNVFTDFSNSFTVPATPNNNKLFKHYYDVDNDNTFNANIRVNGYLEVDSFPLRFGKIQLEGIKLVDFQPSSYKITFYGGLIQLTDLLGDDTLNQLDYDKEIVNGRDTFVKVRDFLSRYDFEYNSTNFIKSFNSPNFKGGNIITPLIAYADRDWNYGTNDTFDISTTNGAILDNELLQAIRIMRIIEAIEAKYGLTFSREFLGGANFNNLFMWLNNVTDTPLSDEIPMELNNTLSDSGSWSGPNVTIDDFIKIDTTDNFITLFVPKIGTTVRDFKDIEYWVRTIVDNRDVAGKFRVTARDYDTNEVLGVSEIKDTNDTTSTVSLKLIYKQRVSDYTMRIKFSIELSTTTSFNLRVIINAFITPSTTGPAYSDRIRHTLPNTQTVAANRSVAKLIPNMKVIEFIQGIMKMFKLIIRPITANSFYLNTLDGYYGDGKLLNITQYVDNKSVQIDRPMIYKDINFKFQKTNNVLGKKFRETQDIFDELGYGDLRSKYPLIETKDTLDVTLPFENMLFERMSVLAPSPNAGDITNLMIGQSITSSDNITYKKNKSKPILFFNNGIADTVKYPIKLKFGTTTSVQSYFHLVGNTNDELLDQVTDTINWGAEIDPWHNQVVANSLYQNYWSNWVETIYSLKQRKFTFDANLPPRYIEELSLNDRIIIDNNRYKINDYKINLTNGKTKFTLFNDIYMWNELNYNPVIGPTTLLLSTDNIVTNASNMYYSTNILVNAPWSVSKADTGDGTDWVQILTPSGLGASECVFRFTEKATQSPPQVYQDRTMNLVFSIGTQTRTVTLLQKGLTE